MSSDTPKAFAKSNVHAADLEEAGKPKDKTVPPKENQDDRQVEEIVVEGQVPNREAPDTVLQMEEVKKIPGTQGDILKIVESLPGVARLSGFGSGGSGVVIRGASPEDSQILIDDHPVPLLYHFGGLKSILNSDMLQQIDFIPGGFDAGFGKAIGGVVNVQTLPCSHRQWDGYVETSLLDAGFFIQGPIGDQAGFFASARRSTIDFWLPSIIEGESGLDMTVAPVYYDYQLKLEFNPDYRNRLSILAFGSSDALELLSQKPVTGDAAFRGEFGMQLQFNRLYLQWLHTPDSGDWQLKTSLVGGYDRGRFDVGKFFFHSFVPSLAARSDLSWSLSEILEINTGVNLVYMGVDLTHEMVRPPKEGHIPGKLHTMEIVKGSESQHTYQGGLYISTRIIPVDSIQILAGLRFDGYAYGQYGDWAVMPRLNTQIELRPKTLLKAGIGWYHQAPSEDELLESFGNPNLSMERAIHYTIGIEQKMPFSSSLEVTYFYKTLDRLVVPDPTMVYRNGAIGRVAGLEFLARRELNHGFFGWMAYTLMRSQRKDAPDQTWRLFDFDQTHILTLVAGARLPTSERMPVHGLHSGWEFGLRFQLVSGNPITPIQGGIFDADYDTYLPIPGPINRERLPTYHRLDIRVDYTWAFTSWALSAFVDLQNTYNFRAIEGIEYNYDYTERAYFRGLPILPALGLRGSF